MADEELDRRVEELRQDFAAERGTPFKHFFCPILHNDEPGKIIRGHIIPEKLGGKTWVPQREDVDNFYGHAVEGDFVGVVKYRERSLLDIWLDPASQRLHRPTLEFEGTPIGHYFQEASTQTPTVHTAVSVRTDDDQQVCKVTLKVSSDELGEIDGKTIHLVVNRDYRSAVLACAIKAAHLTLFRLLGYNYVFSPSGILFADILRRFYLEHRGTPKKELGAALDSHFGPLMSMIAPLMINDSALQGTEMDNRVLLCYDSNDLPFAMGIIVRAGNKLLCVFGPGIGRKIDTYFSFLSEPPKSTAVRIAQYNPATTDVEAHWGLSKPFRIEMEQSTVDAEVPEDE